VRIIRFLTRRQGVNLAGVKVILQLEALGKIRILDLFDSEDVRRFISEELDVDDDREQHPHRRDT
jgi:hypothetical protein